MSEERDGGGRGSGRTASFTASEGVITYKRRKRGLGDSGSDLLRDPSVSTGGQKAMEEVHGTLICSGIHQGVGPARIQRHWKTALEHLLLSQDLSDGVLSCIQKALLSGHFSFPNKPGAHATQAKYTYEGNRNFCNETKTVNNFLKAAKKFDDFTSSELLRDAIGQADVCVISKKCQNVLIEVLVSEKFALLCDLLLENFPGIKVDSIIDLSIIISKMKNGTYGLSTGLLHQDLQQVWERIRKIGQEMALLATSLANISQASCQNQGDEELGVGISEQEYQKASGAGTEEKNSMDSHATILFPSESDRSTKPEQTEASCLYKVSVCKECGIDADGKCSLICDGCEVIYHFSCIMPDVQGIPTQNWYCPLCLRDKRDSVEHNINNAHLDAPHQNCVVCDRLKASGMMGQPTKDGEETATHNESRESSVSSMDSEGSPQPSTAVVKLCKLCGTCEDEDKRFIECGHSLCPYKYYHIRCLKGSQMAIQQQQHLDCWYCPSCLCRACLKDKDDDMIVLCDGCDEAYHTYCMKPPRTSVPEGKWYCVPCNIQRAKQAMKRYEQWVLQQHKKGEEKPSNGLNRSMDLLASAAEKVERLAAVNNNSQNTKKGLIFPPT